LIDTLELLNSTLGQQQRGFPDAGHGTDFGVLSRAEDISWIREKTSNPERARRGVDFASNDVKRATIRIGCTVREDQFQAWPFVRIAAQQERS
jgi:hypothetical protein